MTTNVAKVLKAATGSLLAGSMLMTAIPASAQSRGDYRGDYDHRHHDGIGAGEVIAGAIVIGGIAALLSSGNHNRDRTYDNGYRNDGYRNDGYRGYDNRYQNNGYQDSGNPRQAIEQCVAAVENGGRRRDNVDVRQITNVDNIRGGYRVEGRVAVDYRNDNYNGRYDNRGYGNDYRNGRYDDSGSFSCTVRYGRIENVDYRGI